MYYNDLDLYAVDIRSENVSKPKKIIIAIIIFIISISVSFLFGRCSRPRTADPSGELIERIILSRDTSDRILSELGIAEYSIKSADDYGTVIIDGIERLRKSNEVERLCFNESIIAIKNYQKLTDDFQQNYSGLSEATEHAFDLAIRKSTEYERVIESLRQIIDNNSENDSQSK